jgi:RNA polymerase sigma factor (sigma-70 family)
VNGAQVEVVRRSVRAVTFDDNLADDMMQEGMIAAWQTLRDDPDAPLSHLGRSARLAAIGWANGRKASGNPTRSRSYEPRPLDVDRREGDFGQHDDATGDWVVPEGVVTRDHADETGARVDVERMLARLDPRDAELLRRVYLEDVPIVQVARDLGMTREHVSRMLSRARRAGGDVMQGTPGASWA